MKAYIATLLIAAALTVLGAAAASLLIDPYRIVHPLLGEFAFEPNSRYGKVAYLQRHCGSFDTYIAGDSRSLILSAADFEPAVHRRFYNMASPGDDIRSIVKRLAYLIGRGCPVSAVVVGGSVEGMPLSSVNGLVRREHPDVSGENRAAFYSRYFLSSQALSNYAGVLIAGPHRPLRYYEDGHADYLWSLQRNADFSGSACAAAWALESLDADADLSAYRELGELAASGHFKAVVWIAPRPKPADLPRPGYAANFLLRLRAVPNLELIEADRESPLLSDFSSWHDCIHFRHNLFRQLLSAPISESLQQS